MGHQDQGARRDNCSQVTIERHEGCHTPDLWQSEESSRQEEQSEQEESNGQDE